jgi:hypothetical protein
VLGGGYPVDDELLTRSRLHAHSFRMKTESRGFRQEPGVYQRGLAGARVAVKHHPAIDGDEARQVVRLVFAREEDRVVDEAKRVDPAVRGRRDAGDAFVKEGYDRSSLPTTSS